MTETKRAGLTVRDWMQAHPIAVGPQDSIERARALCEEHRVNQLPVLAGTTLVGIITDRDLRDAFPSVAEQAEHPSRSRAETATTRVEDVMSREVLTVDAGASVRDAAALMHQERIGALPVLRDGHLVGIVTRSNLLRALIALADQIGG